MLPTAMRSQHNMSVSRHGVGGLQGGGLLYHGNTHTHKHSMNGFGDSRSVRTQCQPEIMLSCAPKVTYLLFKSSLVLSGQGQAHKSRTVYTLQLLRPN